jgi:hypothetical protein
MKPVLVELIRDEERLTGKIGRITVWYTVWYGMINSMVWYGMVWYGINSMVWYGMAWHGEIV